ncbi:unnamed protein product [Zymoseptoria tritici ST99CH_1E4]|uniref:BTB domain-containing protein n=1 Tax=Zymoseptoria tritici ST99CH_1E4 TaxID=1276532 RepID=A0A2H1H0G3_ZYMTR|nr:unnamed protein product [Zymoseptoria tritici ST99CH_1E4]
MSGFLGGPAHFAARPSGMDMSKWFDRDTLSDITIKFGDKEVKCHKVILSTRSEYFTKLCDPEGGFAEATQPVVELKDDDPTALEALLRYIYTFQYVDDAEKRKEDWIFHLNYSIVARKYGFEEESTAAFRMFQDIVQSFEDPEVIFDVVTSLPQWEDLVAEASLVETADALIKNHWKQLVELEEFRFYLHTNETILWRQMAELEPRKVQPDLVQVSIYRCTTRNCKTAARAVNGTVLTCHNHSAVMGFKFYCWVPPAQTGAMFF